MNYNNLPYEQRKAKQVEFLNNYEKEAKNLGLNFEKIEDWAFKIILNEHQEIFCRCFDSRACALLSFNNENKIYIKQGLRRSEIGFSAFKEPSKLLKDIQKRLIESEFAVKQLEEIKTRTLEHNNEESYKLNKVNAYKEVFQDLRVQDNNRGLSLYEYDDGKSFTLDIKTNSYNDIKVDGLTDYQAFKLVKFIKELRG